MTRHDAGLRELQTELRQLAGSATTVQERAAAILQRLARTLPFDAGWLAVHDPERHRHIPLATTGPAEPLVAYFGRPEADAEVESLGLDRRRPPMLATEIPMPLADARAWADHLLPAGFCQGLAAGLFTAGGRRIGFLSLLSTDPTRPSRADLRVVAAVTTAIADDLDRTVDIAETARMVQGASAGVVLTRGGEVLPLPGLPEDRLLSRGSPILAAAGEELASSGAYIAFLAPTTGAAGERLLRVTVLDCARPDVDHLSAAVLLAPSGDLRGLTGLDLRVLGLLVEGVTGLPALAGTLRVAEGAVAESLARSLTALRASDLTAATVRALRGGLRIPPRLTRAK